MAGILPLDQINSSTVDRPGLGRRNLLLAGVSFEKGRSGQVVLWGSAGISVFFHPRRKRSHAKALVLMSEAGHS